MGERRQSVRRTFRRRGPVVMLGAVGVLAAVGVAGAAIPDSDDGEIHACAQKNNGQLRVIDAESGDSCRGSESSITWNQRGPSDAFSRWHDAQKAVPSTYGTVLELDVPDGNFAVTATVIVRNASSDPGNAQVTCRTRLPSGDFDIARAVLEPAGAGSNTQTLSMNPVGHSDGPGTLTLDCADGGADVRASWMKITATQVANLTNTPG